MISEDITMHPSERTLVFLIQIYTYMASIGSSWAFFHFCNEPAPRKKYVAEEKKPADQQGGQMPPPPPKS